ncbi:unnamed protein product [Chondrus crispus]|uniref:Uncharacterized protein n=1 Tax=Chondrus crispus TaxID=2769 RepID=R7Q4U3_CHOCR|nr:unnamed protein product [Chondrus crispus]CDF32888.1 unnamed protein product [Chondrus crispus]|eukprot:XP_005712689.1 unnamed protein product [Chondrus crispus]
MPCDEMLAPGPRNSFFKLRPMQRAHSQNVMRPPLFLLTLIAMVRLQSPCIPLLKSSACGKMHEVLWASGMLREVLLNFASVYTVCVCG